MLTLSFLLRRIGRPSGAGVALRSVSISNVREFDLCMRRRQAQLCASVWSAISEASVSDAKFEISIASVTGFVPTEVDE